jgi:hypothetical protein
MSDTEFTRGNCYECGGPVEYPSWVNNEEAPCPHCKRTVILRGCIKRKFVPVGGWGAATPQTTAPPAQPPISTQPEFVKGIPMSLPVAAPGELDPQRYLSPRCIKRQSLFQWQRHASESVPPLQQTIPQARPDSSVATSVQSDLLLAEITRHNKKMENNMLSVRLFFGIVGFLGMISLFGC